MRAFKGVRSHTTSTRSTSPKIVTTITKNIEVWAATTRRHGAPVRAPCGDAAETGISSRPASTPTRSRGTATCRRRARRQCRMPSTSSVNPDVGVAWSRTRTPRSGRRSETKTPPPNKTTVTGPQRERDRPGRPRAPRAPAQLTHYVETRCRRAERRRTRRSRTTSTPRSSSEASTALGAKASGHRARKVLAPADVRPLPARSAPARSTRARCCSSSSARPSTTT